MLILFSLVLMKSMFCAAEECYVVVGLTGDRCAAVEEISHNSDMPTCSANGFINFIVESPLLCNKLNIKHDICLFLYEILFKESFKKTSKQNSYFSQNSLLYFASGMLGAVSN